MTTEIHLPVDDEIVDVLGRLSDQLAENEAFTDEGAQKAILAMFDTDSRRAMFGMLRQARMIKAQLDADEHWLAMQRGEVERKNESAKRSLAFLESQVQALAESLLIPGSKHVDVPGAGRIQYRDYKAGVRIADADSFMESLGPDERASLIEMRPHLKTTEAKKYVEAVLETEDGELLPGTERVEARRTATIEYETVL